MVGRNIKVRKNYSLTLIAVLTHFSLGGTPLKNYSRLARRPLFFRGFPPGLRAPGKKKP